MKRKKKLYEFSNNNNKYNLFKLHKKLDKPTLTISTDTKYFFKVDDCQKFQSNIQRINNDRELNEFIKDKSDIAKRTIQYYYKYLAIGVYVQIKDNKLYQFVHIINNKFHNDWGLQVDVKKYFNNKKKYIKYFEKYDNNVNNWTANNCLVGSTLPRYYTDRRLYHIKFLLNNLCKNNKVSDCEFMFNRRDFPTIHKDYKHPYLDLIKSNKYNFPHPMLPVASFCSSPQHRDITIPNEDDVEMVTNIIFPPDCRKLYVRDEIVDNIDWNDKIKKAIWRGKATGCGVTVETNQRIQLYYLSKQNPKYVDAGITGWNVREKIDNNKLVFLNRKQLPESIRCKSSRMSLSDQLNYKYMINIDGHVSAFRLSCLLKINSVILQVESKNGYYLWYSYLLKPYVHYVPVKPDMSDLIDQIKWCQKNDAKCKIISNNATKLYNEYFTLPSLNDQMMVFMNTINYYNIQSYKEYKQNRIVPEIEKITVAKVENSYPAIIIPYRNRKQHLKEITKHFKQFFGKYKYKLYVINQNDNKLFNRGKLLNKGYCQINNEHTHCIFHDVDMLPSNELLPYYMTTKYQVIHLASPDFTDMKYKFYTFMGGVVSIRKKLYEKINGYPNNFEGWGGEDDAFMNRCIINNLTIVRPSVGYYRLLDHKPPTKQEINHKKQENIVNDLYQSNWKNSGLSNWKNSGLSNL